MNLSNKINEIISNYEYSNLEQIKFGSILKCLIRNYDTDKSEEELLLDLKDMIEICVKREYIKETTSESSLISIFKREAKTINDIEKIIRDEFKIFDIKIEVHELYNNRFEIKYYRNPDYCENRNYIRVVILTESDLNTIKSVLTVKKEGGIKY